MSQLVKANQSQILAPENDGIPMGGFDTEEVLEAVESMQANLVLLLARLELSVTKANGQKAITDIQDQVAIMGKAVSDLANTLKRKPKQWKFTVKKDSFGELESVVATQIE